MATNLGSRASHGPPRKASFDRKSDPPDAGKRSAEQSLVLACSQETVFLHNIVSVSFAAVLALGSERCLRPRLLLP